jgi:hypothetical protein
MIPQKEMVRLLLSDATYTLPDDVDYAKPDIREKLVRIRTRILELQTILDAAADPEEKQMLEDTFKESFLGFNKNLLTPAVNKINEKLYGRLSGGSKKKRKRKHRRTRR